MKFGDVVKPIDKSAPSTRLMVIGPATRDEWVLSVVVLVRGDKRAWNYEVGSVKLLDKRYAALVE